LRVNGEANILGARYETVGRFDPGGRRHFEA
jgi:hypothetical protein